MLMIHELNIYIHMSINAACERAKSIKRFLAPHKTVIYKIQDLLLMESTAPGKVMFIGLLNLFYLILVLFEFPTISIILICISLYILSPFPLSLIIDSLHQASRNSNPKFTIDQLAASLGTCYYLIDSFIRNSVDACDRKTPFKTLTYIFMWLSIFYLFRSLPDPLVILLLMNSLLSLPSLVTKGHRFISMFAH